MKLDMTHKYGLRKMPCINNDIVKSMKNGHKIVKSKCTQGRKHAISADPEQASQIANCIENYILLNKTYILINESQMCKGLQTLSRSSIKSFISRLNPKVTAVTVLKQGSQDPMSKWALARKNWVLQLLLRMRET